MIGKKIVTAPIRFYRAFLSGRKRYACCKYAPSCSEYALQAIEERGVIVGAALALWRILRCNPFSRGGYDPVPVKKTTAVKQKKENKPSAACGRTFHKKQIRLSSDASDLQTNHTGKDSRK